MIDTKDIINMLNVDAARFDIEAENQKDRITGAYFTGKAESHRLTVEAINCIEKGDTDLARDALNGDI